MSDDDEYDAIVIDNGSGVCKAGFAGDDAPRVAFPSVVGSMRSNLSTGMPVCCKSSDTYIGDKAQKMRGVLSLDYPIERGIITDWDAMEKIWSHTFNDLRVNPKDYRMVLPEVPLNPKSNAERKGEVMFETFNVSSMIIPTTSRLSIYASGRGTAISVDSGDGVTTVYPLYEGYDFKPAIKRIDYGGKDLTHYLMKLLHDGSQGHLVSATTSGLEITREIKEKLCKVSDGNIDFSSHKPEYYQLPDGRSIELGREVFQCPEAIFDPSLCNLNLPGVHQLIMQSLNQCSNDAIRDFSFNILISGANTRFNGFPERLLSEILKLNLSDKPQQKFKIVAPPERAYSVWIGGSILGSLSSTKYISKQEYSEYGPSIFSRREH